MIVVLCGAGGVGKGSIVQRLVARDATLRLSRSWTTRPHRQGEDENAYVWTDRAAFLSRLEAGGFLEHDEFLGNLYGTPVPDRAGDAAGDDLMEINVQGAEQVRARYPDALVVFVVAPSRTVQEARLRQRGDDDDHVQRRLAVAAAEEARGRALADHVVVNDDLDRAVDEVAGILAGRRGSSPADPPKPEAS